MGIVYFVVIFFFVLIVPIVPRVYAYYDGEIKRLNFSICLLKLFKIFGGYVEIEKDNLFIHYGDKNTALFKSKDAKMKKGSLKSLLAIELLNFSCVSYVPVEINYLAYLNAVNVIDKAVYPIIKSYKPFCNLYHEYKVGFIDELKIYLKITIAFNLITLIQILIKRMGK